MHTAMHAWYPMHAWYHTHPASLQVFLAIKKSRAKDKKGQSEPDLRVAVKTLKDVKSTEDRAEFVHEVRFVLWWWCLCRCRCWCWCCVVLVLVLVVCGAGVGCCCCCCHNGAVV